MWVNVWQLSKYYDYDKNLAECSYCTSETTLASQLLDAELQKVPDNEWVHPTNVGALLRIHWVQETMVM